MRIAVLILGLLFNIVLFLQTVLVGGLSDAVGDEATATSGAVGVLMSLLWFISSAFVLPFPMVSVVCFTLAGILGFAASGDFPDLAVWGGIALILAVMSFFGWRGKRKDRREAMAEKQRQQERDNRMETLMRQQVQHQTNQSAQPCPSCRRLNPLGTRFCGECGSSLASGNPVA